MASSKCHHFFSKSVAICSELKRVGGVVVYKRGNNYFVNKVLSVATVNLRRDATSACYLCVWSLCTTGGGGVP